MNIPGYTIIRELGQGGMATVYLARQDRLGREVALKVMKPLAIAGDDFISRFIKEGQIIAQLQHPQIVIIYDFDTADGLHYFSMEYLPRGTLAARIKEGLTPRDAIAIARLIAKALAAAHARGIVHRDVKPQNIMFREDGTAVLTDFGIARAARSSAESMQLTGFGMVIGSPPYMSPEQSMGQPIDARSDIYSLGIVLYEMLTRQLPYQADDPISLAMKHCTAPIPRLPDDLKGYQPLLERMIAKKPEDRFSTAEQLIRYLDSLAGEAPTDGPVEEDATRILTPPRAWPAATASSTLAARSGERPIWKRLAWVAVGGLVALGVILVLVVQLDRPERHRILDQLPPEDQARPETAVRYERLVIEHLEKNELDQAHEILRLGLAATPTDTRLMALRQLLADRRYALDQLTEARQRLDADQVEDSLTAIERGLERVPDDPGLTALRDRVRERALVLSNRAADERAAHVRSLMEEGRYEEAMDAVALGLAERPDHVGLRDLQTELRSALQRREQIDALIRESVDLLASDAVEESLAVSRRGLDLDPNHRQLLDLRDTAMKQLAQQAEQRRLENLERATALLAEGDLEASARLLEEGLAETPDDPRWQALARQIDERRLDHEAGERLAEARAAIDRGDLEVAMAALDAGLALVPGHAELTELREGLSASIAETSDRNARLEACQTRYTDELIRAGQSPAAVECYREILGRYPHEERASARIAAIENAVLERIERLLDQHDVAEATRALDELQRIDPDHPKTTVFLDILRHRRELLPELIEIEGGCFLIGSPETEAGREPDEQQREVCVKDFALARVETTVAQFERFVNTNSFQTDAERGVGGVKGCWSFDQENAQGAWRYQEWASWRKPNKYQDQEPSHPVSCISINDAQAYLDWLSRETALRLRLPSEAEWEYAARAGTQSARFWGDADDAGACRYANSADQGSGWAGGFPCDDGDEWAASVGRFEPNPIGLQDMLGNLWEWTCSLYAPIYTGVELECAATTSDEPRIMRGGAWNSGPALVRSAYRNRNFPEARYSFVGFRVLLDTAAARGDRREP